MSKELIDRIRELQAKDWASPNEVEAADTIEQQQSWIASLEQNARDADRLYKELEGELAEQQKRIDGIERKVDFWRDKAKEQMQQLAASQVQIKVLRDALEDAVIHIDSRTKAYEYHRVLEQPADDSALRELLKAERDRLSGQVGSIGKFCKSEDDCIDQGIDFAAYEIGLIDSIEAVRKLLEKSNG